jgi:glycine cleavage system H protein
MLAQRLWFSVAAKQSSFHARSLATITKFTKSHEYITIDDQTLTGTVGISDYAQSKLGDVVFVELPEAGKSFKATEAFGSVESVKAASDVYMPIDGKVIARNDKIEATPGLVNQSALTDGWFIKIKANDLKQLSSLLDAKAYEKHCESEQ